MSRVFRALLASVTIAAAPFAASAQASNAAASSVLLGVFTEEQAQQGAGVFQSNCSSCHAMSSQTGPVFERNWSGKTVYDYFQLIRSTMPHDEPGRLSRSEYVAIVAFLLKSNGFPAAADPLPDDDARLKQIRIEPKRPSTSSPAALSKP